MSIPPYFNASAEVIGRHIAACAEAMLYARRTPTSKGGVWSRHHPRVFSLGLDIPQTAGETVVLRLFSPSVEVITPV